MIDLELPGVGVRLGVHQDALRRRPRRGADTLAPSNCRLATLPPTATTYPTTAIPETRSSVRRRRPLSTNCSSSSLFCGSHQEAAAEGEGEGQLSNVLRLSLRKPGEWQWQLRTSASSPALLLPAVQLYDHRGRLLVDTSTTSPSTSAASSKCHSYRSSSGEASAAKDDNPQQNRRRRRHHHHHCRHNHRHSSQDESSSCISTFNSGGDLTPAPRGLQHGDSLLSANGGGGVAATGVEDGLDVGDEQREPRTSSSTRQMSPTDKCRRLESSSVRRTQSSGAVVAPCGRHRHHRSYRHHHLPDEGERREDADRLQESKCRLNASSRQDQDDKSSHASEKDQGYGSERSPDEERHFPGDALGEACETVSLQRGQRGCRGLGLSVCGGADCSADGLVRIRRLFPFQPAWQSGRLRPGDVLLAVNGRPLSGLTNHEALEMLRTAPDRVLLTVARTSRPPTSSFTPGPPQQQQQGASTAATLLQPPQTLQLLPQGPFDRRKMRRDPCGELEVTLSKVQGSLGFTLRKEDSSVLGHYVRALVREPALSDGRIRPGDKIVAVNGVDICLMSHAEAVVFLRHAGDTVTLKLYRDVMQTPVSALSPTEPSKEFVPKTLRREALDMLSDLAVRRATPNPGESSTLSSLGRVGRAGRAGRHKAAVQHQREQRSPSQSSGLHPSLLCQEVTSSNQSSRGTSLERGESPLVDLMDSTVSNSSFSSVASVTSVVERPRRPGFLDLGFAGRGRGRSGSTPSDGEVIQ